MRTRECFMRELWHRSAGVPYDLPAEIGRRVERYVKDRNLEHLVDAANMCMLAYIHGGRQGERMEPVDDGEHTPVLNLTN